MMLNFKLMENPSVLLVIVELLLTSEAVNPGCECIMYTSTFGKPHGTFTSPDYPRPYLENINCMLFTFSPREGEQIVEITFKDFDVHKSHLECERGDFLKVFAHLDRPEVNEHTPWTSILCGTMQDVPRVIYSSGPGLVLELHSDSKISNSSGFLGHFRFLDRRLFQTDGQKVGGTACDYQITSSNSSGRQGHFYSPRYPSSYPRHIKCVYRFKSRLKERIRIVFEEVTLQKGDLSCLNRPDVVKVHDGRETTDPVIAVLCNEAAGFELLSSGPDLLVEFASSSQRPGQGFKALYQFQNVDRQSVSSGASRPEEMVSTDSKGIFDDHSLEGDGINSFASGGCDLHITSDHGRTGVITSPAFPSPYPPRTRCRFDFRGRGKERVHIHFSHFGLMHPGPDADCENGDSLGAYVSIEGRLEKVESYCGHVVPKPIMSNGLWLVLDFRGTLSSPTAKGFRAIYTFTENFGIKSGRQLMNYPCGFIYYGNESRNGTFTSPNFPGLYPRDTECHYFFRGRPRQRIRIRFTLFDVEGIAPCEAVSASDYVEFSNYMTRDRKYPRYCGQLPEFTVESDRRFFRVLFRSNDRLDATGFHAHYQFLDLNDISSPHSDYEPSAGGVAPPPSDGSINQGSVWIGVVLIVNNLCYLLR